MNTCLRGVLVAISIPIFTTQLEKAREATDLANLRAAYAEGTAAYLDDDTYTGGWYDIGTGTITSTFKAAGKGTATTGSSNNDVTIGGFEYKPNTSYAGQGIKVTAGTSGVTVAFSENK